MVVNLKANVDQEPAILINEMRGFGLLNLKNFCLKNKNGEHMEWLY